MYIVNKGRVLVLKMQEVLRGFEFDSLKYCKHEYYFISFDFKYQTKSIVYFDEKFVLLLQLTREHESLE